MTVLDDLAALSSAEDFFAYLEVPFAPSVVQVARLHILRRMGQYLKSSQIEGLFDGLPDEEIKAHCRDHLGQAYQDFVESSPIAERLFKVHKEAVVPKTAPEKPFVSIDSLTLPAKGI